MFSSFFSLRRKLEVEAELRKLSPTTEKELNKKKKFKNSSFKKFGIQFSNERLKKKKKMSEGNKEEERCSISD